LPSRHSLGQREALDGLARDCGPDDGNGQVRDDPRGPNNTPFGIPRAVSLDGRSLGPHHGATHPRADPGQKQDPAKVTTYAPTPSNFPRCWCRGSAPSRSRASKQRYARSDPPLTELAPLSPRGRGAVTPAPRNSKKGEDSGCVIALIFCQGGANDCRAIGGKAVRLEPSRRSFIAGLGAAAAAGALKPAGVKAREDPAGPAYRTAGELVKALADRQISARELLDARSGSYRFGGGNGSRTGSGLIFARIAFNVRMRGDNGNRSPSIMSSSALSRAAVSSSVRPGIINQWPRVRSETGRQQGALTNSGNLSQGKRDERNRHRQSARPAMPLHTRAN
jgi:hypothetical protein